MFQEQNLSFSNTTETLEHHVTVVLVSRCDELLHLTLYLHLVIILKKEQSSKRETARRDERRLVGHLVFLR